MALNLVVDAIDQLDEPLRALYVEKDGKFHLDVAGLEDTSGLKSALEAERNNARNATRQTAAWRALGKTPEEIKELLEARAATEEEKATKAGEWDKLKTQMNDKHALDLKAKDDAAGKMRTSLERYLVDAAATTAIAAAKGVPELLLPHVQRQVKVLEEDGEFVARVVDAKGDLRVDGKGEPMTISALIEEMKKNEIYGRAFEGSGASGGGMLPNGGGGGGAKTMTTADFNALDPKTRAAKMAAGLVLTD